MTYKRLYRSFRKFIDQDQHFTEEQQHNILKSFEDERSRRVFRLSIILLLWSAIGVFIDSTLIGGGVIFSVMKGINWHFFIPAFSFFVVNFTSKILFVRWYMKGNIKQTQCVYCAIPYAGSALILGFLLARDPLFLEGLRHYLKYLRKQSFKFVCKQLKDDKNCSY